jgi:hypothetical protein
MRFARPSVMGGLMAVAAAAGLAAPAEAAGPKSVYSRIDLDACSVFRQDAESGSTSWFCPAIANQAVWVAEDDLRFFVSFGRAAEVQVAAQQTLPPFNRINDTLEWRIGADGAAYATILRWFTEFDDGRTGQVLVVTKVSDEGVCHVAYVDALANKDANELARQAADTLTDGFDCETGSPVTVGKPGRSLG